MELQIGKTIRALRKQQGRTQENLADALGISFQAVSRWESAQTYPDMELVPAIANYFGVSIDYLFGYDSQRQAKIDGLIQRIRTMDQQNNGQNVCTDECIRMARDGLAEFPGNEELTLCLANLLYNAGYARHGEHHLTDPEGYDVYDAARHRTYTEWQEAKTLYEQLIRALTDGPKKQEATLRLTQLCAVTGETDRALALIEDLPDVSCCSDLLRISACDGKRQLEACEQTIPKLLCICANLQCRTVMASDAHMTAEEAIRRIRSAIALLDQEKDDLSCHEKAGMYLYLSVFLWRTADRDGAFEALAQALTAAKAHDRVASEAHNPRMTAALPSYWPRWCIPDHRDVEQEIKADPRWNAWVQACAQETP